MVVLCVAGTNLVAEAAARHKTAPTATAAIGRTLLGTLLLGAFRKEEEATQVTFRGDGPIGQIAAIATTYGEVKVSVGNPEADPPLRPDGKLAVGTAVGKARERPDTLSHSLYRLLAESIVPLEPPPAPVTHNQPPRPFVTVLI